MDYAALKVELDSLYAQLNEPHGVVPEWAERGLTSAELLEVENRVGIKLPPAMKQALMVFSGISHETPYYLGSRFAAIQKEVIKRSKRELTEDDFSDDLEIAMTFPPQDWDGDELNELRAIQAEGLQDVETKQLIAVDCDTAWLKNEKFLMIGTTYSESLFINLIDEKDAHYGALYNAAFLYPFFVIYKVADSYEDFLVNLQGSLKKRIDLQE